MVELSGREDEVLGGIDMKRGPELSPLRPVLDRRETTGEAEHELLPAAHRVQGQHEQPRPARAYWLTDEAVSAAAGRQSADRPGLDQASAEAAENPPEPPQEAHETASEARMVTAAEADEALLALLGSAPHA